MNDFTVYIILFIFFILIPFFVIKRIWTLKNKNKKLEADSLTTKSIENKYNKQVIQLTKLDSELIFKQEKIDLQKKKYEGIISMKNQEIDNLAKEINILKKNYDGVLSSKNQEINKIEKEISYIKKAYEKQLDYKNININNTILGAHFIKNVINHIYEDLKKKNPSDNIFSSIFKPDTSQTKFPSIKALKNIYKLLDYNVAVIDVKKINIKEELKHLKMFIDLIEYLKPKTKIVFKNTLNSKQEREIMIMPTLFFPFLENVLKHGSLNNDNSSVHIDLKITNSIQLKYSILNSAEQKLEQDLNNNTSSSFGLNALDEKIKIYYPESTIEHRWLPNNQYLSELFLNIN